MPSASAMRSMCTSTANCVCGAPKPRNAPLGGVLVIIARPRMRTWSQRYGPVAWMHAARQHHRRSASRRRRRRARTSMSIAVSRPSRVTPVRWRTIAGMPLGRRDHVLDAVVDRSSPAGRALSASSAAWPAIIDGYSSLPPNPPPVSVCTTRTLSSGSPSSTVSARCT